MQNKHSFFDIWEKWGRHIWEKGDEVELGANQHSVLTYGRNGVATYGKKGCWDVLLGGFVVSPILSELIRMDTEEDLALRAAHAPHAAHPAAGGVAHLVRLAVEHVLRLDAHRVLAVFERDGEVLPMRRHDVLRLPEPRAAGAAAHRLLGRRKSQLKANVGTCRRSAALSAHSALSPPHSTRAVAARALSEEAAAPRVLVAHQDEQVLEWCTVQINTQFKRIHSRRLSTKDVFGEGVGVVCVWVRVPHIGKTGRAGAWGGVGVCAMVENRWACARSATTCARVTSWDTIRV